MCFTSAGCINSGNDECTIVNVGYDNTQRIRNKIFRFPNISQA